MKDALVLLSGGLDSAVALAKCIKLYGNDSVGTISFQYGQRHNKELFCAEEIAASYMVSHKVIDLADMFSHFHNPLIGKDMDIPKEQYNAVPETFVPFRNGIFLSVAAAYAYEKGYNQVVISAHSDDLVGSVYPDCSPHFIATMASAITYGTGKKVHIYAPFVDLNKAQIVSEGITLNVNFKKTWSCYEGGDEPCGVCGTCIDRRKAFEANGLAPQ